MLKLAEALTDESHVRAIRSPARPGTNEFICARFHDDNYVEREKPAAETDFSIHVHLVRHPLRAAAAPEGQMVN